MLNGEICPGTSYGDLDAMIRENDLVARDIPGKNSDKIVIKDRDGEWKMTAITYNESPGKMIVLKRM